MYTKYDCAFYYKNPEIQLIINLQRIRDDLGALLHVEHCDRCMGLKCKCLDIATIETAETAEVTKKDVRMNEAKAETNAKSDVSAAPRIKDATKDTKATTTWYKDTATKDRNAKDPKWSFKFSPLDIEDDTWRRADQHRRPIEVKYLSSETVEEFFQTISKRSLKCS